MLQNQQGRRWIAAVLLTGGVLGCGDGRVKLPTAPVTGIVTYQNKPLGTGRVLFFHSSGHAAGADLAVDGSFHVSAYQGQNQVAFECDAPGLQNPNADSRANMWSSKSLVPERYTNHTTSGLTFEVKPGENSRAEFSLED